MFRRVASLVAVLLGAGTAHAAPTLEALVPFGGPRGGTVKVRATGSDLGDVTGMWFSDSRLQAAVESGGKPNEQFLTVTVPADQPAGLYECRLLAKSGVTEARLFCVGTLAEVSEGTEQTTQVAPVEVKAPVTVVGTITGNANADWIRFPVKKGEWVTVVCVARAAGSRLDPFLRALDPAGRTVVRDDDAGANRDARIHFQAKQDGAYTLELRDLGYRGGDGYPYRLSISLGPYVTRAAPMAVQMGAKQTVRALVSGETREIAVTAPADAEPDRPAAEVRIPETPDALPLFASRYPQVVESEAHGSSTAAQPLSLPCGVTGVFGKIGEEDYYRVTLKKGQRLQVRVRMANWNNQGSPSLMIAGPDGKPVKFERGSGYDAAETSIQAAADGDYTVCVHDLLWKYRGGPEYGYYAEFSEGDPADFTLRYRNGVTAYAVAPGAEVKVPMLLDRRNFDGPVALEVRGLPEGCTYEPKSVTAKRDFDLVIKCGPNPGSSYALLQIVARAEIDNTPRERLARAAVRVGVIEQDNVDTDPEVTHLGLTFTGMKTASTPKLDESRSAFVRLQDAEVTQAPPRLRAITDAGLAGLGSPALHANPRCVARVAAPWCGVPNFLVRQSPAIGRDALRKSSASPWA